MGTNDKTEHLTQKEAADLRALLATRSAAKATGWICPKCGRSVSPREQVCPACEAGKNVRINIRPSGIPDVH